MADAPSGGGGSSWGPFEILLLVLLAIGLLSALANKGKGTPVFDLGEGKTTTDTSVQVDTSGNTCGLAIVTPLSLARVSTEVHLSGYVNGCNWTPKDGVALYAQVINASGMPVSDYTPVLDTQNDILYTAFDTTLQINGAPTGSGYILLTPATPIAKPISVRIPLQFVRK